MITFVDKMDLYLQSQKDACKKSEEDLIKENRKDEANLFRISYNIYDIFCIMLHSCEQQAKKLNVGQQRNELISIFEEKLDKIPQNWRIACSKAKEYGNMNDQVIEETKLDVVKKIKEQVTKLAESQG